MFLLAELENYCKSRKIKKFWFLPWLAHLPYLNPKKHCWDMINQAVNMREVQPTNLIDSKVAFSKKRVNLPPRSNNKLMKSMPRQIGTVVKAH